jgi:hypothetical protein
MKYGGSLQHSQELTTCSYPEPDQSSPCPHPTSWISILIWSSHLCLGLSIGYFPQVPAPKSCMHLSSSPYVLHFIVPLLSQQNLAWSTEHRGPRYIVLSIPVTYPSYAPYTWTLSTQNNLLKNPSDSPPMFVCQCDRPIFTPLQHNK